MIKKLFTFLLLLLVYLPLLAQIKTTDRPFWVDEIGFEHSKITAEKVSGGQAYLLVDHQYNLGTEEVYVHYSYQVLSETGIQNGSIIEVTFDPAYESLSFIGIDVYRDGVKTDQLNLDNFQVIQKEANAERFIYDGQKTAILHLSDIRVGDVVDYRFILKGRNPAFKGMFYASFYLNFQEPLGRNYKKILVPAQRTLHVKSFETDIAPEVEVSKYKTYRWDQKNIEGLLYDLYTPSWFDPYARVQISEYESWTQISNWALPLYTPKKSDLQNVKQKAAQIKKQNKTKEDQVTAALNFVQDEVRYLGFESGLNSFVPHSPSRVLKQRFGDCKDKSLLLSTLLNALGVEAHPALVSSNKGELLPEQLPSPQVFDHCIVKASVNGKTYWYDPTISNQGGDYASTFIPNYKYALVIKEGTSRLEAINTVPYSKIESRETYTIKDYEQPVLLHVTTIYKGQEADFQRQFFMRNSLPQIRKNYLNYYTETYPRIKVTKELTYDDDPDINIFTTYEDYEIPAFWKPVEEGNERVVKCEVYPQMVIDAITDPGHVDRVAPLFLNYPKDIDQIIEFYFPDEWSLQNTSNRVEAPGIIYTDFVTFFGKKVTLNYTLKTLKDHLKPDEFGDYYEKVSKIKPQLGYVLTHNKDLAQAGNNPNSNWMLVVLSLIVLMISLFLARKVYFYYDPFSPHKRIAYDQIGGWLILVGIGITLSPFLILFTIFNQDYFDQGLWVTITTTSSPNYSPILAISLVLELMINIVFLVFSSLLAILFYKRRSSFPRLVIIYYVVSFLFLTVDALVVGSQNILPDSMLTTAYKDAARSFLAMIIWVPYFLISERVKETFVNTEKDFEETPIVKEEVANA